MRAGNKTELVNLELILGKGISNNIANKNETLVLKLLEVRESFELSRKAIAVEKRGINLKKRHMPTSDCDTSPNEWSKAYGASSRVRLYPASVGAETKTSLPTDMLWLFSSDSHTYSEYPVSSRASFMISHGWNFNRKSRFSALNYFWVTTISPRVLKSYSDWSKCSDSFLGRLNWC